jgi:P pilus assembly chaperone PapD
VKITIKNPASVYITILQTDCAVNKKKTGEDSGKEVVKRV